MILRDKLIKDIRESYTKDFLDKYGFEKLVEAQLAANRWIPVEERLPECEEFILVSFENYPVPDIGQYRGDKEGGAFYSGDSDITYVSCGIFVNAWQPLPKPYRSKETKRAITESGANFNKAAMKDPCRNCFGAASNDCHGCWKSAMMDTFLGSRRGDI